MRRLRQKIPTKRSSKSTRDKSTRGRERRTCGAKFGSDEAAHEHRRAKLHWPPNISCQTCLRKFSTLHGAQKHLHTDGHRGLIMSCKMCLLSFKTKEAADQHMKNKNHLVIYRQNLILALYNVYDAISVPLVVSSGCVR
jgi:hypothetical protein